MAEEKENLTAKEYKEMVDKTIAEIHEILHKNTGVLVPKERWLVYARVINVLFGQFYTPMVSLAVNGIMREPEEELAAMKQLEAEESKEQENAKTD